MLPRASDLTGSNPNITEGLSTEEYIGQIRNSENRLTLREASALSKQILRDAERHRAIYDLAELDMEDYPD